AGRNQIPTPTNTIRTNALENKRRWKNINVRGLPDTMEVAEFSHYFRRLLSMLFSAKQAKAMTLD
ncbi:Hypothetical predicted protein, partial [Pelobates cultripes]